MKPKVYLETSVIGYLASRLSRDLIVAANQRNNRMWQDPIVEEVREARIKHAEQFDFDLKAIYQDLKKKEQAGGWEVVSFPPRRVRPIEAETRTLDSEA